MKTTIYRELAEANKVALLYSSEYKNRLEVLTKLYTEFTAAKVEWAISCSCALFLEGIVDNFHDLDLIVSPDSYEKIHQILTRLGKNKNVPFDPSFNEIAFSSFDVDGIDIDVICEFGFTTFDSCWQYNFNKEDINVKQVGFLQIPYVPAEVQYIFYGMMVGWQPQRTFKRDLIATYLTDGNLAKPHLLKKAAESGELPPFLTESIYGILGTAQ